MSDDIKIAISPESWNRVVRERDEAREIIKIVAQDKDKIIEQLIVERDSAREIYKTLHSLYADEIVKNRNI